jgi:hypothetical protein
MKGGERRGYGEKRGKRTTHMGELSWTRRGEAGSGEASENKSENDENDGWTNVNDKRGAALDGCVSCP